MAKASANLFPYVHLVPAAPPTSPATGAERVYLDSGDGNKLKRKNSAGTVVTIEGGGGSGTSVKDRRWTVGAFETTIDEFNDDSLDVAWTRVDGTGAASGNCSWTEGADTLTGTRLGTNTGNAANGLVRAIGTAPATGDAWVTCVTLFCPPTQYSKAGIVISDGTALGAGKQVEAVLYKVSASSANSYMSLACTNWNETGATTAGGGDIATPGTPVFLRLVYKGSSQWRTDVSPNGVDWLLGSAMVTQSSFTPAYVGFFSADAGSGIKHIAAYEFLRRVAGVS